MPDKDRAFLLEGGAFSEDIMDRWIARTRKDDGEVRNRLHPYGIEIYFNL